MVASYVAKDADIVRTRRECAAYESELKKLNYILGTLKDSHIYFRNLSKNKTWQE
jgi:hypothetical protein